MAGLRVIVLYVALMVFVALLGGTDSVDRFDCAHLSRGTYC